MVTNKVPTKILIADDNEKLLSAMRLHLEAYGFAVTICTDSYMALAHARKARPDIMVLDIRMPAGDGFSVLERINNIPELRGIPVIYITGDQSPELDLRAEQLGACGLIHKPISLPLLIRTIDTAMESGPQRGASHSEDTTRWTIPDPAENQPYEIGEKS